MGAKAKLRETVARELEKLPDEELTKLLDYIRFLKLKSLPDYEMDARFVSALETARQIARQEGITEEDIRKEIAASRSEK
jgi:predicted transcriptional regulator